jgi:DNA polymerase-3 subunit gamma/tau
MSYRVLARKYRPQNLEQLVGQENLAQSLKNAFENNRVPHAILLHGIRGVGKTTTARIIAKSLNCLGADGTLKSPQVTPCDVCMSCQGILTDRHMDVVEIDAASHTGVDDMRELTESSRYKAVQGRYKIFIIDEVHMLSKSAFNALLKTLEEPPPHVKFIFATTEIKKIPDTILSRCMRFDLSVMQPAKIIKHLQDILEKENILAEVDALAMIARAADGSMRDALSITDQAIMLSGSDAVSAAIVQAMLGLSNRDALFEVFESIFQGKVDQAIKTLHTIYENGGDPLLIAQDLIHILYWVICLKNAPSLSKDMAWPEADRQKGQQLATLLPTSVLLQSWDLMQKSYDDVRSSYQPSQALDVALMRLAFVKDVLANPSATSGGHNVQSSSVTSSVSRASMPQTFEAMADLLLYAKEGLLHGHILHDVHLISYAPGHLVCGLGGRAPKNFMKLLKDACERITKQSWDIELRQDTTTPTIIQAKAIEREALKQQALNHPLIKEILHVFPAAKVTIN